VPVLFASSVNNVSVISQEVLDSIVNVLAISKDAILLKAFLALDTHTNPSHPTVVLISSMYCAACVRMMPA
jgi:hypothetical protein